MNGNYETIMSVAIVGALGTAIVAVVKAMFSKNENATAQHEFIIRLVEMTSKQSENISQIYTSIGHVHERLEKVERRLEDIENEVKKE